MSAGLGTERKEYVFPPNTVPVQILRWVGERVSVTTSGSSQRLTLPTGSVLVEITAKEDVFISFGGAAVDASAVIDNESATDNGNRFLLAGVQVVPVPLDSNSVPFTHVAVIQVATAGVFQADQVE